MQVKLTPQFVMDTRGRKTAVILPVKQYDALLEDLRDLAVIAERRDEKPIPHHKVLSMLKNMA